MKDLQKYQAVFFDVGGTLLRVHPSVGAVYARHARAHGFTGTAEELDRQFGSEWKKRGGMEALGRQSGAAVEHRFWHGLVADVFQPFGGLRDFDAYFATVYKAFESGENWHVFEDVRESRLLEDLRARGVKLGVVSNWDSRLPAILKSTGLDGHFDFILASTVVGSAKPDAGIFQEALRRSNVPPEAACHIGDEVAGDFHGARNAGLDAILLDRRGVAPGGVTPKIRTFMELAAPR